METWRPREDAERWVTETVRALGSLDILINSAGVTSRGAPTGWDWERVWDWVMAVKRAPDGEQARGEPAR